MPLNWIDKLPSQRLAVKLTVVVGLLLAAYAAMMVTLLNVATRGDINDALASAALRQTQTIAQTSEDYLSKGHLLDLEQFLETLVSDGGFVGISVFDTRRMLLLDSDPETQRLIHQPQTALMAAVLADGLQKMRVDESVISLAKPIVRAGVVVGVIETTIDIGAGGLIVAEATRRNILLGGVFLFLGLTCAIVIASRITAPIRRLKDAIERLSAGDLAAGDFNVVIEPEGHDEIAGLTRSFRLMARSLHDGMEEVHKLATLDDLTGLPNRTSLNRTLDETMEEASRTGRKSSLLVVDIRDFKRLNETLGHADGDAILEGFAARLRQISERVGDGRSGRKGVRPGVFRLGGGSFAVLTRAPRNTMVAALARRLLSELETPLNVGEKSMVIQTNIGICVFPTDTTETSAVLRNAEMACSVARLEKKNSYRFYETDMSLRAERRLSVEMSLRDAVRDGAFVVHYQPQISCASGRIEGVEALVRWNHPVQGLVSPAEFIPIAEESGLIIELGQIVAREACQQTAAWRAVGMDLRVAINISMRQLEAEDFVGTFTSIIQRTGLPPEALELELTETLAMNDPDMVIEKLAPLSKLGVRLAIDDFGQGHSSLASLNRLPVDAFKIDRAFVNGVEDNAEAQAIVRTILTLGRHFKCEVVAEGVENSEQFAFLRNEGATMAQGFLFAPGLDATAFESWYADYGNSPARGLQDDLADVFADAVPVA